MVVCYPMLTTAPDVVPGLDSRSVAIMLGVTYRQLDHAIRCVNELGQLPGMAGGSGSRRRFSVDTLRRLDVAARLAEAHPGGRFGYWPHAVAAVMRGPEPPLSGFAVLSPDGMIGYPTTLRARDFPVGPVGGVVRYDLTGTALGVYLAEYASAA
jgi:hypothetical protein